MDNNYNYMSSLLPRDSDNFTPPPIPKKSFLNKKWIWITLGLVIIIIITAGIIIALNGKSTSEESVDDADNNGRRYIQSEDQLRDGEIAMYDSDGRMYAVEIDEDYYSGNGIVSSNDSHSTATANNPTYSSESSNNSNLQSGNSIKIVDSYNNSYDNYSSSNAYSSNISSYTKSEIEKQKLEIGGFVSLGKSEWAVLDINKDRALVVSCSCYGIKYNNSLEDVTWETSSLRRYLNEDFYNRFTIPEKKRILTTDVANTDNPDWGTDGGNNTQDKIFILNDEEINRHIDLIQNLLSNHRLYWSNKSLWIRMPGKYSNQAATIGFVLGHYTDYDGLYVNTDSSNIMSHYIGRSVPEVVPAMWIKLDE